MTNIKNTKRALLSSAIALFLCFAMLLGTTFAWFTDSVTSDNNVIKSGTLDVTLEWAKGIEDPNNASWTDASKGAIFNNDKWEPGYTEARHLKISNVGTLALNWSLAIVPNGQVSALADVIDVYYYDNSGYGGAKQVADRSVAGMEYAGTLTEFLATPIVSGKLDAEKSYSLTIVFMMREDAGNEYQNLSIGTDFAVKLLATQQSQEPDSFDNTYDEFAGKTVVTPADAQAAIWAAQEGDIIYLQGGAYDTLVLENEDGSPKKGITIERSKPGSNSVSNPFSVGHINLNGSEDITIRGIWFDIAKAEKVYSKTGETAYYASITGAKSGAASGPKNIVIDNCVFDTQDQYWSESTVNPNNYVPICFEEASRPTFRATNITVTNCVLNKDAFNFIRACYLSEGTLVVQGNKMMPRAKLSHAAIVCSSNSADLMIRDNAFYNWNSEKAMLSTSRNGSHQIKIEVTGNTLSNTLTGEGVVLDIKPSYTADNTAVVFEGNTFSGGLAGMTEANVPVVRP